MPINIGFHPPIKALDDEFVFGKTTDTLIDVLKNDRFPLQNFELDIIKSAVNLKVSVRQSGRIRVEPPKNAFGTLSFSYRLSHLSCPDNSDSATVNIRFPFVDDGKTGIFNTALTPTNPVLKFPIDLSKYPHNHLFVFNRWGQKMFEAQPYNNDWEGQTQLNEGDYFYFLKLDSDGNQRKGTIYKPVKP